ncbi:hypothetical protein DFR40_2368 [Azonexus fungiphilus]|uniref:Lipoprotein n=1 Tax=Azonexus fungiphilus TaxID=146940 RepID=A0A495VP93_9RHOO|nr:hypothetical protein [Azonexus fungiphilus]RKT51156.1 hypothetical protein DFR40_2368 [Azonexus fungiphilus]
MKRLLAALAIAGLSGCAERPAVPDWLLTADAAIGNHVRYHLEGRDRLAAGQLAIARNEVARTGDATQMARIELHACAARVASLESGDCPGFLPLAADAAAAENAYAAYLAGNVTVDVDLLPKMQQLAWRDPARLEAIADPLSRLLAAALLWRDGRLSPAGIALAIESAAGQGWRRPLLAWLLVERQRLEKIGDSAGLSMVDRRLRRISGEQP